MLHHLTPRVFWVQDTCTVCGIRGATGLALIDCGMDLTTGNLAAEGAVEELLLTHSHRDQCSAAGRWQRGGARVTIPFAERRVVEVADLVRAAADIFNEYTASYPGRGPLLDIRADRHAHDCNAVQWHDMSFVVVPLPGHTPGSTGYLFTVDGQRFLACGDLRQTLAELFELFHARSYVPHRPPYRQITPDVHEESNSIANCYVAHVDDRALPIVADVTWGDSWLGEVAEDVVSW